MGPQSSAAGGRRSTWGATTLAPMGTLTTQRCSRGTGLCTQTTEMSPAHVPSYQTVMEVMTNILAVPLPTSVVKVAETVILTMIVRLGSNVELTIAKVSTHLQIPPMIAAMIRKIVMAVMVRIIAVPLPTSVVKVVETVTLTMIVRLGSNVELTIAKNLIQPLIPPMTAAMLQMMPEEFYVT